MGSVNDFYRVEILEEKDNFLISYLFGEKEITLVESNNKIIGGWGFLLHEEYLKSILIYYKSMEECLWVINKRTPDNLRSDFDAGEDKSLGVLFSNKINI